MLLDIIIPSLITSFGWGLAPIFEKKALFYLPPYLSVAIFGIFFGIFGIIILCCLQIWKPEVIKKNIKDLKIGMWYLFIAAFLAYIIGTLFFFIALGTSNKANIVILITYTLPIIIAILATIYILNEKLNNMMIFGIILTITGLVLTISYKDKIN
jgi:drug/metabolite transporter (DMT)-like permease